MECYMGIIVTRLVNFHARLGASAWIGFLGGRLFWLFFLWKKYDVKCEPFYEHAHDKMQEMHYYGRSDTSKTVPQIFVPQNKFGPVHRQKATVTLTLTEILGLIFWFQHTRYNPNPQTKRQLRFQLKILKIHSDIDINLFFRCVQNYEKHLSLESLSKDKCFSHFCAQRNNTFI